MKKILCLIAALPLAACTATGPLYSEQPVEQGKAQLVIYHPSGQFIGSMAITGGPDVKVNGMVVCALPNSAFFVTSATPGETEVSSTQTLAFGTSILDIKTKAGKRYFVRIIWDASKVESASEGNIATMLMAEDVHPGPFFIDLVDEAKAASELSHLKMTRC